MDIIVHLSLKFVINYNWIDIEVVHESLVFSVNYCWVDIDFLYELSIACKVTAKLIYNLFV